MGTQRKPTAAAIRRKIRQTVTMLVNMGCDIQVIFDDGGATFFSNTQVQLSEWKLLEDADVWLCGYLIGAGHKPE